MDEKPEKYRNKASALGFLKRNGFKIEKTKFYADAAAGLVAIGPDGSITRPALKAYADSVGLEMPATAASAAGKVTSARMRELVKNLRLKNAMLAHDLEVQQGRYVLKSDANERTAEMIGLLEATAKRVVLMNSSEYALLVGGDPGRAKGFVNRFFDDLEREVDALAHLDGVGFEVEGDFENEASD